MPADCAPLLPNDKSVSSLSGHGDVRVKGEPLQARVGRLLRRRGRMPEEPSPTDPVAEQTVVDLLQDRGDRFVRGRRQGMKHRWRCPRCLLSSTLSPRRTPRYIEGVADERRSVEMTAEGTAARL
jgi:hypothetical protein